MEWFTWASFVGVLGVLAAVLRLRDRAVKEARANENRFTILEAKMEQSENIDKQHDEQLKELRAMSNDISEMRADIKVLSELKADIRDVRELVKNGK